MNYNRRRKTERDKTNTICNILPVSPRDIIQLSFGLALKGIHLVSRPLSLSTSVSLSHYTEWHTVHHPDTNLLQNLEGGEIIKDMGFVGIAASIK